MAYCDNCDNFDESYIEDSEFNDEWKESRREFDENYQPDLYYYWDEPLEEDYNWRESFPHVDCMCEICFDIANRENKIKWNKKNPFELMLDPVND